MSRACSIAIALSLTLPLGALPLGAAASGPCRGTAVDVGGRHLWVDGAGTGALTVAFEAGGGRDGSVWTEIAARVRDHGVRTFIYDRAGLGRSELGPTPYSIDDEVHALRSAWSACGIESPVVVVAHSYGGAIALLAASRDERVAGLVLVDALVPRATPDSEVQAVLAEYRPQYAELRKQAPELARAMIPLMEAYPETVGKLDAVHVPARLRIIDIVAEHTTAHTPRTATLWRQAHADFVAQSPLRQSVLATGSSHQVMADKPALVVDAIVRMIALVQPPGSGAGAPAAKP